MNTKVAPTNEAQMTNACFRTDTPLAVGRCGGALKSNQVRRDYDSPVRFLLIAANYRLGNDPNSTSMDRAQTIVAMTLASVVVSNVIRETLANQSVTRTVSNRSTLPPPPLTG